MVSLKEMAHVIMCLFLSAKDPDFLDVATQEATKHGVTRTDRIAISPKDSIVKYAYIFY